MQICALFLQLFSILASWRWSTHFYVCAISLLGCRVVVIKMKFANLRSEWQAWVGLSPRIGSCGINSDIKIKYMFRTGSELRVRKWNILVLSPFYHSDIVWPAQSWITGPPDLCFACVSGRTFIWAQFPF